MGASGSSNPVFACSSSPPQDFHDKYLLGQKLGRGSFAEVYVAEQIKNGTAQATTPKAVKVSRRGRQGREKARLFCEEELWAIVRHHDNCVRLYDVFHGKDFSYMVMERCKCSLHHHIKSIPDLTERTLGPILSQMLRSLCQVHWSQVVHRDIKPENFLVGGEDGQTVKLCDFGLSARLLTGNDKLSGIVGTPPFACPEMLLGKGYDFKADVWSVGVIAYAFFFGLFPYMPNTWSCKHMKKAITEGSAPTFVPAGSPTTNGSEFRSSTALKFVRRLLSRQPEQRPSAIAALNMEYMISIAENGHVVSVDLPSLEPMILSAQQVGAFGSQDVHKHVEVDALLNDLQMKKHQVPLFKGHPTKANSRNNSQDTSSDSMSIPSTACPSDPPSRHPAKASEESTQNTDVESMASTPSQKIIVSI